MQRVPTTRDVLPGAFVNIVLKADQRTGRTVSGAVQDVLTRGNHPRGIKVRLTDGRIGRVQTMADATSASAAPPQVPGDSTHEVPHGAGPPRSFRQSRPSAFSDIRDEEQPTASIGLDAYVKPAKQRKPGKGKARQTSESAEITGIPSQDTGSTVSSESGALSTCPVCGAFEGDEAAVAHHVAGHFDD
ncbi:hypothetical protein B0T14DRAFT_540164 [Immersiella caudata]|uniref:UBZ4-type domain-containing protein n=1 Tax=Immersiella caudata TaxID=314043 RepID=A0AA39T1C7_9PEZI|nr:hypothetical protein B0T14DRAFT_540164 [Immersiella caudata]